MGVTRHVEVLKVELPDKSGVAGSQIRQVSVRIGESDSDLDEMEDVDVGFEELVVIGGVIWKFGFGLLGEDDSGELRVH